MNSNSVVCVDCNVQFKTERIGVYILETYLNDQPYKLWNADLLRCPGCGRDVVARLGQRAIDNHDPDFERRLQFARDDGNIFLCNEKP